MPASPAATPPPATPANVSTDDESIAVDLPFDVPAEAIESSLDDSLPAQRIPDEDAEAITTYTIIDKGTEKGKPKLVDSDGFSYCIK